MSKKMMNKLMSSLYVSYFSKEDYSESLLSFTFFEFSQRFGFKKVIEKKFVEFICSLIYFSDSRRCRNFLRFISAGVIIKKKNFCKHSLKIYLSALNFMMNSKVGLASFDDSLDIILIPLVRATEYFKEKLENFGKSLTGKMIAIIEKKAIPDPKKINGSGVVENELVLETLAENYEELRDQVINGVEFLINTINYKENKSVLRRYQISLMFRWVCPQKLEDAEGFFCEKDEISSKEFCDYCIEKLALSMNELHAFYLNPNKTTEETQKILSQSRVFEIFQEISKNNKLAGSNEFWDTKLRNLTTENDRSTYETLFALHLYTNELERIRSIS